MLDRISFVIGEAMIALRRNGFMTFSAITTVAIALYLLGGLGYLYVNVDQSTRNISSKFEIYVYLRPGTEFKAITETAEAIRKIDGAGVVSWIPKDKAWALLKQQDPDTTAGIEDNPLPDSYKVTLTDLGKGDAVAEAIKELPAVQPDGVKYFGEEQRLVNGILNLIRWLSSAGALLLVIAGILIFNTIRQAILARRTEIRIMQLVGASRPMIYIPFLLEGLVHGVIGGSLAAGFVWLTNHAVEIWVYDKLNKALPIFPTSQVLMIFAAAGAVYGVFCSAIALRLRNQA
ncbi:cell division protein FtsX [Fimbriimonas ginsengisoli]|uniref:Cell division protein FtsX n=1 Tax=Fimbriimonas ginsengisoli Gsoil 348 TaxID=661478 RepID=A0A068NR70_FIMGI|nr:permease-like cell division protein FtsX [Fimbriimonas ginsengisoli]AIE84059.1 Cell division protein FtsX [Fimbriimonas ginsengisoli Gsoil 348]